MRIASLSLYEEVSLPEWSEIVLAAPLDGDDYRLLESLDQKKRIELKLRRDGVAIRAVSWVGVIRLSMVTIRIVPKLANGWGEVARMIAITQSLSSLERLVSASYDATKEEDILDLLLTAFVRGCERLLSDGVLFGYIEQQEPIAAIRGRWLPERQVLHRAGRLDLLECRFDEHSSDIAENRLLAAALSVCRWRSRSPSLRLRLDHLTTTFEDICETVAATELEPIEYNRLNEHYRPLHELARMLLDGFGVSDVYRRGPTESFAFLVDMNRLFEQTIRVALERAVRDRGAEVVYQSVHASIIRNADSGRCYSTVRPDFLVRAAGEQIPVDAKYKVVDDYGLGSSDIYQAFLYAKAFAPAGEVGTCTLIHPATGRPTIIPLEIRDTSGDVMARVNVIGVLLPALLAEISAGVVGSELARIGAAV